MIKPLNSNDFDLLVIDFSQVSEHVHSSALHYKALRFQFAIVTKDFDLQIDHSRYLQCTLVLALKVSTLEFASVNELLMVVRWY